MDEKALKHLVRQAADELDIDVPIMRVRAAGGRLELFLYGGARVAWPIPRPATAATADPGRSALSQMTYAELRELAGALKIVGRSRMKKDELVKLISLAQKEA